MSDMVKTGGFSIGGMLVLGLVIAVGFMLATYLSEKVIKKV